MAPRKKVWQYVEGGVVESVSRRSGRFIFFGERGGGCLEVGFAMVLVGVKEDGCEMVGFEKVGTVWDTVQPYISVVVAV